MNQLFSAIPISLLLLFSTQCQSHSAIHTNHWEYTFPPPTKTFVVVSEGRDSWNTCQHFCVSFIPRGGGIGGARGKKLVTSKESDSNLSTLQQGDNYTESNTDDDVVPSTPSFDLQERSSQLRQEEIREIRKSQQFLEKQRMRRELDKTWLDKGITAFIEFFENLFRWEVVN